MITEVFYKLSLEYQEKKSLKILIRTNEFLKNEGFSENFKIDIVSSYK